MKKVAILGATGLIGQQFTRLLINHPSLELAGVFASSRSAGKPLSEFWGLPFFSPPSGIEEYTVEELNSIKNRDDIDIVFSGLPASIATDLESELRAQGKAVFSNSSSYRMAEDVPILIPEINESHIALVDIQKDKFGGFIITNANCSVTGAAMYLSELKQKVKLDKAIISTYQALSGAGLNGVASINSTDNVIPYIQNEEYKIEIEAKKILGSLDGDHIIADPVEVIATAVRVPVIDGHTESITCLTDDEFSESDLINHFSSINSPLAPYKLHTAPSQHVIYLNHENRPQPRLDRLIGDTAQQKGMVTSVGRIRTRPGSISAMVLVHNTIRGGAGGSVLNAELACSKNLC